MYFPYVWGRQHELSLLRTLASRLATSGRVVPVIEPVKSDMSRLERTIKSLDDAGVNHAIVINPSEGELANAAGFKLIRAACKDKSIRVFAIRHDTTQSQIDAFVKANAAQPTAVVHWSEFEGVTKLKASLSGLSDFRYHLLTSPRTSTAYRSNFSKRVRISDAFIMQVRNADYPPEDVFSELHLLYKKEGDIGFGDFLFNPDTFREGGGPAHAVALHLTYAKPMPTGAIYVRHFVSDTKTNPPNNNSLKFLEALKHLVSFIDANKTMFAFSSACTEFRRLHKDGTATTLGKAKEVSMQHHVELMMEVV